MILQYAIIKENSPHYAYISQAAQPLAAPLPVYARPEEFMHTPIAARLALLAATVTWGTTFLITQNTLDAIDTYYLLAIRFSGAALLLGLLFHRQLARIDRVLLRHGALLGLLLFAAYVLQTEALKYTTPGKTAFFSAVDCVAVPFLAWCITRRRPTILHFSAALLCLGGIGCVSLEGDVSFGPGELLALGCGILFGAHIYALSQTAPDQPILTLTVVQFVTTASLAWLFALLFNQPPEVIPPAAGLSLFYLCVFATALAFICQTAAQRMLPPSTAALILSLEAVFGVICAILFAQEPLTPMMLTGFALIFAAILIAELLPRRTQT